MDLELLKNISEEKLEKLVKIATILDGSSLMTTNQASIGLGIEQYESFALNNLSLNSQRSIETTNKKVSKYFPANRTISSITLQDAEKFVVYLRKTAPKGYKVYVRTLKAMFNKFLEWNYITSNVFTKIKLPKTQTVAPKYLKEDEFESVMKYISIEVVEDFCRVAYDTGARLNELVFLRWVNVDMKKRTITIGDEKFTTKTRGQRIIPMSEKVYQLLDKRYRMQIKPSPQSSPFIKGRGSSEYVFGKSKTKPYTGDYFSKKFKAACREGKIDEGVHMHSLRHSAATRMAQGGAPLIAVQKILGHTQITTTMIYAHSDLETMRKAVGLL